MLFADDAVDFRATLLTFCFFQHFSFWSYTESESDVFTPEEHGEELLKAPSFRRKQRKGQLKVGGGVG